MINSKLFAMLYLSISLILPIIYTSLSHADNKKKVEISEYPSFKYVVVADEYNAQDEGKVHYSIKKYKNGKIDNKFLKVQCFASPILDVLGKCDAITLPDGKLLLADCFQHNSVCYSCRLVRFNSDGSYDTSFITPFTSSHTDIVNGTPEHEIKDIKQVEIIENGGIRLRGDFISPLVDWTKGQAQSEYGDDSGRSGIVHLSKNGAFISFVPKDRD